METEKERPRQLQDLQFGRRKRDESTVCPFLKNENSAELCVLDQIPGIEVIHLPKSYGFYNTQSEEEKAETKQMYEELWKYALDRAKNGACDMLVMDEFMAADRYGLIPHEEAIQF